MRKLYRMHYYSRPNILVTIAINRIVISTNLYPSRGRWRKMDIQLCDKHLIYSVVISEHSALPSKILK